MKRFFGLFKRKTTSSQSQSGDASGHQDPSSEEASKPEPGPTSPGEWVTPGEIPSAPTPSPRTAHRISRQERRRRERELRKMIRKRESHVFVSISWSCHNYSGYISRVCRVDPTPSIMQQLVTRQRFIWGSSPPPPPPPPPQWLNFLGGGGGGGGRGGKDC